MISIIIPLYNKEHTIQKTLECVLNQTFQDFEIIIVDDGSTDKGVSLIKDKFNDSRIRIISQENQGVSVARNTGIKNANGEWISFLDADDLWNEKYLEHVKNAIAKFPDSSYIIGGRKVLNVRDGSTFNFIPAKYHGRTERISFFENPHVYCHISASTIKKELLDDYDLNFIPGQRFHEDFTFTFQAALLSTTIYIGLPLVTYCGGVEAQATSNLKKDVRLKDGCLFRNTVIHTWLKSNKRNRLLPIFMKYETRHCLLVAFKSNDKCLVNRTLDGLSDEYKASIFTKVEVWMYKQPLSRYISINWIKFSKVIWRLHGFPVVGGK